MFVFPEWKKGNLHQVVFIRNMVSRTNSFIISKDLIKRQAREVERERGRERERRKRREKQSKNVDGVSEL